MKFVLAILIPVAGLSLGIGFTKNEFAQVHEEEFTDQQIDEFETPDRASAKDEPKPVAEDKVPEDAPRVEVVNGEYHDFGVMMMFGTKSHVFVIKNVGKSYLTLSKLDSTCKCTVGQIDKEGVPPGGTANIRMEWLAKQPSEEFRQMARFRTNDPRRPVLHLNVVGAVQQSIYYYPPRLRIADISYSQDMTSELRIFTAATDDLQVLEHKFMVKETAKYFEVKTRKATIQEVGLNQGMKSGRVIFVKIKKGMPEGRIEQQLLLKLNLKDGVKVLVPILGRVTSDVTFFGKKVDSKRNVLRIGPISRAQGFRTKINVLVKGSKTRRSRIKVKIKSVDPPGVLKVSLSEGVEKKKVRMHILTVEIPPNSPSTNRLLGKISKPGEIILETQDSVSPEVRLRVSFAVQ